MIFLIICTFLIPTLYFFFILRYWLKIWYISNKEDKEELELMYYNDRTVFDYLDIYIDK